MTDRRRLLVRVLVVALVVGVVGVAGYVRFVRGVPLVDEWACSRGEVPVDYADGGSTCVSEGEETPAGATLDPLGNRPLSCDGRWGWRVIERGEEQDCLRDGLPLPAGWRLR